MRNKINGVESSSDKMDKKIQNFIQQKKDENMALKKLLVKLEIGLVNKETDHRVKGKN